MARNREIDLKSSVSTVLNASLDNRNEIRQNLIFEQSQGLLPSSVLCCTELLSAWNFSSGKSKSRIERERIIFALVFGL